MKTLHELATEAMNLQPGDTVRVLFSMPGHTHGWENAWYPGMDHCINKTYEVKRGSLTVRAGVLLDTRKDISYAAYFSPICLELVSRKPQAPDYPRTFLGCEVVVAPTGIRFLGAYFSFEVEDTLAKRVRDTVDLGYGNTYQVASVWVNGILVRLDELKKFLEAIYPAVKYYRDKQGELCD